MGMIILRCVFVFVAAGAAIAIVQQPDVFLEVGIDPVDAPAVPVATFGCLLLLTLGVVAADIGIKRKQLDAITAVYFGLIVGLSMAYLAYLALTPMIPEEVAGKGSRLGDSVQLVLSVFFCYICVSLLLQTRHDFRFIIPYVEFSKEVKGGKPCVLDTSVVIDGRIADVVEANLFDTQLIMPKFVIAELQGIADSSDRMRRSRGRRGLDILSRLRSNPDIDVTIYDRELPEFAGQPVDMKLVILAKSLDAKLITNDYNLNKVARIENVSVINLNDVSNALKPVFLPGEHVMVRIVKAGEAAGQGVGYLDDGTMVVVEGGRDHVNEEIAISVTNVMQTSAGRMVFGRYDGAKDVS